MDMEKRNYKGYNGDYVEYNGVISEEERDALRRVLAYLEDERTDYYTDGGLEKKHIYNDIYELEQLEDKFVEADNHLDIINK